MEAATHTMVNRPAPARPAPAAAPVRAAPAAGPASRTLASPYVARFAGVMTQARGPAIARSAEGVLAAAASAEGKRLYRTGDGKLVELPDGVTAEDAARLEAEAKAAQQKLGQRPPPPPVPDGRQLARKPGPREAARPPRSAPGARTRARATAAAAVGAAAVAGLAGAVSARKVAQYLAQRAAPVLRRGIGLLQVLRRNEKTHDTAGDKLHQSERAVVIPPSEGQSRSNAVQVTTVDRRPAPPADPGQARAAFSAALSDNAPHTIEDVDNFQRDQGAAHVGASVLAVVQGTSNTVTATFGDVTRPPPPAPPEHTPEALPPEEVAPATAALNLGQGAVAPLQPEHTDVSNFTRDADTRLKDEGITQAQLDMVDSGDLAAAGAEKKGLEARAKTQPVAVQKFAAAQAHAVDGELRQDEKAERDRMRAKRKQALQATAQKQHGTRSALEKKRDEVAARINGIYQAAQDKVKKKLADLETESMKRFDAGNAAASKVFEDNVHRELDAFKDDRYSGWFGWARKAKDWLLGMDDLPEVKAIFDRNRQVFVATIHGLVEAITADQKRVIQECKAELAGAEKAIQQYVASLGPSLQDIGHKAAADMTAKLHELDALVDRKQEELAAKLQDKQTQAIKAIDEKIEKMKDEMSGALSKLGKLLLLAAKKFFTWALEKFGYSLSTIDGIINKGVAVLKAIFTQPIQFVKNLVRAAGTGFENFGKHFLTHLKNAVFEWLTGSLQGLVLPSTWDLKGILGVVFQMLGLTYANFRAHLVRLIPEPVVKALETTFALVKTLVTEGPMAAWEQLKEIAGEIKDAFIEAVKDWIKWKLVQKAIETILSLLIPGAGLIRAIVGIYDTIVFFIQRAKDIAQMIGNFLGSIAEIAAGNIGAAASALEAGLARGLVLVIDFLARFLRLSGITEKIREVIHKLRDKVDGVMAKVAGWIVVQARKLGKLIAGGAQATVQAVREWWRARKQFANRGGETHTLFFQGTQEPRMMIATDEQPVEQYLAQYPDKTSADYQTARSVFEDAKRIIYSFAAPSSKEADRRTELINTQLARVSAAFARLAGEPPAASDYPTSTEPKYSGPPATHNYVEYIVGEPARTGSRPGDGPDTGTPGWRRVHTAGLTLQSDRWVQMHVVSMDIGGAGRSGNLVSAPGSINTGYFREFERKTIALAKAVAQGIKNVLWFDVTVSWRDREFANQISGHTGLYIWKGKTAARKWQKVEAASLAATATIPRPDFHEQKMISLNFSSGTDLRRFIGDDALAELVKQNRPYASRVIFVEKLSSAAASRGIAQHQQKIAAILSDPNVILHDVPE